ncbi:hypothetical protein LINGRAHAP2_LOCUS1761 [Linum grandiflorum]
MASSSRPAKRPRQAIDLHALRPAPVPEAIQQRCFNFSDPRSINRWLVFQRTTMLSGGIIDWDDLREKGWARKVARALSSAGLLRIFELQEESWEWPTKEVLTTFAYKPTQNPKKPGAVTFQLGGQLRTHSIDSVGVALGLYTEEELAGDHGLVVFTSNGVAPNPDEFWHRIAPAEVAKQKVDGTFYYYESGKSKAGDVVIPLYRLLHLVFRQTICQRLSSDGVMLTPELFMIHHIEMKKKVHMAPMVARLLKGQYDLANNKAAFVGGHYITRLMHYHGCTALFEDAIPQLRVIQTPIGSAACIAHGVRSVLDDRCRRRVETLRRGATLEPTEMEVDPLALGFPIDQPPPPRSSAAPPPPPHDYFQQQQQQWGSFAQTLESISAQIAGMQTHLEARMDGMQEHFDGRFTGIEDRQTGLEDRQARLEHRVGRMEAYQQYTFLHQQQHWAHDPSYIPPPPFHYPEFGVSPATPAEDDEDEDEDDEFDDEDD